MNNLDYQIETKLLQGNRQNNSQLPSIIFFTIAKCASNCTKSCLEYLNRRYLKLDFVDFVSYLWHKSDRGVYEVLEEKKAICFQAQGFFYAPLRKYIALDNLEDYRVLLMLRDPRDVLVSNYYSVAYSHRLSLNSQRRNNFLKKRELVQNQTIDKYVITQAEYYYPIYRDYYEYLINKRQISCLRYQDFVQNFEVWIAQLEAVLKIKISEQDKNYLFELKGDSTTIVENKFNHIRKATPGDYREKLSDETIDWLNANFHDVLSIFND